MASGFLPSICFVSASADWCPEAHRWKRLEIWTFDQLIPPSLQNPDLYVYHVWGLQQGPGGGGRQEMGNVEEV